MDNEYWTDGSCSPNPGAAGWAFAQKDGTQGSGMFVNATNNIAEMTAAIEAINHAIERGLTSMILWTDSQYIIDGITKWVDGWERKGWKTFKGDPVKNQDLWKQMKELTHKIDIDFRWIKGHSGVEMNELVDRLAVAQTKKAQMMSVPF